MTVLIIDVVVINIAIVIYDIWTNVLHHWAVPLSFWIPIIVAGYNYCFGMCITDTAGKHYHVI